MLRFLPVLFWFFGPTTTWAQCTALTCVNQVDISLDQNGQAVIAPSDILSTTTSCPGPKTVTVRTQAGILVPNATVDCSFVGQNLEVTVTDVATGNSCWGLALIEDKLPPLLVCNDLTVSCSQDTDPAVLGFPAATDNCGGPVDFSFFDAVADDQCDGDGIARVITRTIFAAGQGGTSSCTQTITVTTAALADVVFPSNLILDCATADTSAAATGLPTVFGGPVSLACKLNLLYNDQTFSDCPGNLTVLRSFTVIDCCTGETLDSTQIIRVLDDTPPAFACPDTLRLGTSSSFSCTAVTLLPTLVATDDCSGPATVQITGPDGTPLANGGPVADLPLGNSSIEYTVSDACGNAATCSVPVIVTDNQPPVLICDELTSVNINSTGLSTVPAFVFDDGGYDACCGPVDSFEVRRMSEPVTAFAPAVVFDCDDVGDTVMVVVRGFDCFGNFNECMVEVEVEDKILPSLTCPPDVTLDCSVETFSPQDLGLFAVATDNCTLGTTSFRDDTTLQNMCGPLVVERTFFLVGPGPFRDSCVQIITFEDNEPPVYTFPADITLTCSALEAGADTGRPTATDNCGEPFFFLNVQDDTLDFSSCELKIVRTFSYLDMCTGFDTTAQQSIKLIDDAPPVFDQAPSSLDTLVTCISDTLGLAIGVPTATDGCDNGATITLVSDVRTFATQDSCANEFSRRLGYLAADVCGNVSDTFFVRLTVADTVAPVFTFCPPAVVDTVDGQCGAFVVLEPMAFDNCGAGVVITNDFDKGVGMLAAAFPIGQTVVTFTAADDCGNVDTCQTRITVHDGTPPQPTTVPANQRIELDGEGAGTLDLDLVVDGIRDNCNSLPISIGIYAPELDPDTIYLRRDTPLDPGASSLVVPIDTTISRNFCNRPQSFLVELFLADSFALDTNVYTFEVSICRPNLNTCGPSSTLQVCVNFLVGGAIRDLDGMLVEDVLVRMEDATLSQSVSTNVNGSYYFELDAAPPGLCVVYPEKNNELLEGVSTYDIVLLSRHILGTAPLNDPYRLLAADVNNSGSISTLDIVALRRAILHLSDAFPNNTSYRFLPADHVFADPLQPWLDLPSAYAVGAAEVGDLGFNFTMLKVGDLNPAPGHAQDGPAAQSRSGVAFHTPDQAFAPGDVVRVPLYAAETTKAYGLQAAWTIDETQLRYLGAEAGSLSTLADAHAHAEAGTLRLSYATGEAMAVDPGLPLGFLLLRANTGGTLARALHASAALPATLYTGGPIEQPLDWQYTDLQVTGSGTSPGAILYPNRPNPFRARTQLAFALTRAGVATLRVYDTAGRVRWADTRHREAGRHEVLVALPEAKGLLYYQLITDSETLTGRMVAE